MQPRDAVAPVPDHSFARRVAVATGVTTAIAIGGTIAVICASPPRAELAPQLATVRPAAVATPEELALALMEIRAYAFETYPAWVVNNPDRTCPRHLLELNEFAPALHAVDPWGSPYQFVCGEQYGAVLSMRSAGPDRTYETADDLSTAR